MSMDLVQQKVIKKVVRTPQLELLKFVFGIVRGGYNIQWIHPDPALHHFKIDVRGCRSLCMTQAVGHGTDILMCGDQQGS